MADRGGGERGGFGGGFGGRGRGGDRGGLGRGGDRVGRGHGGDRGGRGRSGDRGGRGRGGDRGGRRSHHETEKEKLMPVTELGRSMKDCKIKIGDGENGDHTTTSTNLMHSMPMKAVDSRSLDYSHFISLPLAIHPGLVDKLIDFQNTILQIVACVNGELGIEKSMFIKPKTFHLTILMLKLWNKEQVNAAVEVLRSVSSQVMDALHNRPVSIKLKGLDCMIGTWAKARVLDAPVEEVGGEGRLLRAIQVIIDAFAEAGLLTGTDVQHKLKLHATLMNVRHRERNKNIDARGIFDRYGSEEWGEYRIHEAHLSQRFVYDESGYYHCCASIPFPDNSIFRRFSLLFSGRN